MEKIYAQKGKIYYANDEETVYFCGTYLVSLSKGSAPEALTTGLIQDNNSFLLEKNLVNALNAYKRLLVSDFSTRLKIRPKKVIKELVDGHLFLEGKGKDEKAAIRDILDQASFWPLIAPGTGQENLLSLLPDYFHALNHPQTLSALEKRILDLLNDKALETKDLSARELHDKEKHKKYYVTIDSLAALFKPEGITREEIYVAVKRLFTKHCISFYDKEPYFIYEAWDTISIATYRVGTSIGLYDPLKKAVRKIALEKEEKNEK